MPTARITIRLKPTVLDAQGAVVRDALRQMQRSEEPARSYDLPDAASEAPAPPDTPGGEVDAERGAE